MKEVIEQIKLKLDEIEKFCTERNLPFEMSDIGNSIGMAIGNSFNEENGDLDDFIRGVKHGVSLADGTHP